MDFKWKSLQPTGTGVRRFDQSRFAPGRPFGSGRPIAPRATVDLQFVEHFYRCRFCSKSFVHKCLKEVHEERHREYDSDHQEEEENMPPLDERSLVVKVEVDDIVDLATLDSHHVAKVETRSPERIIRKRHVSANHGVAQEGAPPAKVRCDESSRGGDNDHQVITVIASDFPDEEDVGGGQVVAPLVQASGSQCRFCGKKFLNRSLLGVHESRHIQSEVRHHVTAQWSNDSHCRQEC